MKQSLTTEEFNLGLSEYPGQTVAIVTMNWKKKKKRERREILHSIKNYKYKLQFPTKVINVTQAPTTT